MYFGNLKTGCYMKLAFVERCLLREVPLYVVIENHLFGTILTSTYNIWYCVEMWKLVLKLFSFLLIIWSYSYVLWQNLFDIYFLYFRFRKNCISVFYEKSHKNQLSLPSMLPNCIVVRKLRQTCAPRCVSRYVAYLGMSWIESSVLRRMEMLGRFSPPYFLKGNNFYDFVFAFMYLESLLQGAVL